jgi:hypothetical protein
MRQAIGFILILVLGIAGAAGQEASEKNKAPDYSPLKPGTKWVYELNNDGQKVKLTIQVAKLETIGGKSLALVETSVNGMVTSTEHMLATENGVFRHRNNGVELTPPVCVLKYPFKKGETWETDATIGNESVKVKGKAGDSEEITVAAGKFKTVQAVVDTAFAGNQLSVTSWFAPDVGIVKQSVVTNGKTISAELEKFEAGK